MTVSYNLAVASVNSHTWVKLLFRWRGSIWKSVVNELALWIVLYYMVMFFYRSDYFLTPRQQEDFERVASHMNKTVERIPLTFMLGFFVTLVVDRWRQIFTNMGWIENAALTVSALIRGNDPEIVLIRRSIIRYLVLTQVLVFRDISMKVRRRFPNMESIVKAGFMFEHEKKIIEEIDIPYNKYWAPINWACTLCMKMRLENNIASEPALMNICQVGHINYVLNEIKNFRTNLALLCNFDWVPIPLAYPQVVFLAVRVYFLICLVGRQFIVGRDAPNKSLVDMYVPVMTCLQFIFVVGWMKVAEALLNPLGEDDDDFECNFLIDKNIATGMAIVDDTYDFHPKLEMDAFKTHTIPMYSEDSKKHGTDSALVGSAAKVTLASSEEEVKMVEIEPVLSDNERKSSIAESSSTRATTRLRKKISDRFSLRSARRSHSANDPPFSLSMGPTVGAHPMGPTSPTRTDRPFDMSFNSVLSANGIREVDEEGITPPHNKHLKFIATLERTSEEGTLNEETGDRESNEETENVKRVQSEKSNGSGRDAGKIRRHSEANV